jgi:hypothetical protein
MTEEEDKERVRREAQAAQDRIRARERTEVKPEVRGGGFGRAGWGGIKALIERRANDNGFEIDWTKGTVKERERK